MIVFRTEEIKSLCPSSLDNEDLLFVMEEPMSSDELLFIMGRKRLGIDEFCVGWRAAGCSDVTG